MSNERIPAGQFSAWLFTAMTPTLIQLAGGASWLYLLGMEAVCLLLHWRGRRWGGGELPRILCVPVLLLMVVVLGELAEESAESWPMGNSFPAVPLILLALAAWSAGKGAQSTARVGAVLFWFLIIMYMVVFAAGIKQIRWRWLAPTEKAPDPMCIILLLLPTVSLFLPVQRKSGAGKIVLGLGIAVASVMLAQGILSPEIAEAVREPVYEMSRSLELLGIAQRFEALVCAAATAGWFAVMCLLLSVCGECAGRLAAGWSGTGAWLAAILAGVWLLCGLHIDSGVLAFFCAVFWVFLPLAVQGIGKIKKS